MIPKKKTNKRDKDQFLVPEWLKPKEIMPK
jgi:hypothetical protein